MALTDTLSRARRTSAERSRLSSRSLFAALAALDFTRPLPAVALGVVYLLTRLPFIGVGYGADPDAARVAVTAHYFWETGVFYPSRLPGYPLYEIITTALYPLGHRATNAATLVVSFAGVLLFAAILKRLRVEPKGLLTLTFAFAPMVWINSSITLDYLWGLTFVLGAYLAALHRRWLLGGVLLGVAIGCRPTSALFALPFFVLLVRERQARPLLLFFAATGVTALLAFVPIMLNYGLSFLTFFDVRPTWGKFARTLGVEAFGLASMLGLIVVALLSWRRFLRLPALLRADVHLAFAVMAILLVAMSFLRLPLEEAYLTPVVPFVLLGAARLLSRRALLAVCALLVLGGLLDFHTRSEQGWQEPAAALAGIRPQPGRVLVDYELRRHRLKVARGMRTLDLPPNSVVTAGFYYPIFLAEYQDELDLTLQKGFRRRLIGPLTDLSEARDERGVVYIWLMGPGDARRYRAAGYRTYTMDLDGRDVLVTFENYLPEHERFGAR